MSGDGTFEGLLPTRTRLFRPQNDRITAYFHIDVSVDSRPFDKRLGKAHTFGASDLNQLGLHTRIVMGAVRDFKQKDPPGPCGMSDGLEIGHHDG